MRLNTHAIPSVGSLAKPHRASSLALVVDDEAVDQQMIRHYLESSGRFHVLTADNYEQALAAIAERWDELELALLDVALPARMASN
jgi:CheY-like chemotaxis protein